MLTICTTTPADALALLGMKPPAEGAGKAVWDRWTRDGTFLALVVEQDQAAVGLTIAESHPTVVHVHILEGNTDACGLLLERLVRMAGERNISVRCPVARTDVQGMLEGLGFARQYQDDFQGRPSYLYRRGANEDEVDLDGSGQPPPGVDPGQQG